MKNSKTNTDIIPPFVFFGTPYTARDTLEHLRGVGIVPAVIVTNPPAASGRGLIINETPVAQWARMFNVPTLTPISITPKFIDTLKIYNCNFAVVVAYGKIFPETLIKSFPYGMVNIHYSLLPKYRGAAPVETAMINGETITGVSLQYVALAVDSGDIIATTRVIISPTETVRELRPRLINAGATLLYKYLSIIANGNASTTAQNEQEATYAPKIQKSNGRLSRDDTAYTKWNKYRSYIEWSSTYFYATRNEKRIRVKVNQAMYENKLFIIKQVTPDGKRKQTYDEFVRAGWNVEL